MVWAVIAIVAIGVVVWWHVAIFAAVAVAFAWLALELGTAFVVGAPLFWLLCVAESGFLCWCLDSEDDDAGGFAATVSLLAVLALFQFFGNIKVFTYVWHHPWWTFVYLAGYLFVGGAWSVVKWWFVETGKFNKVKEEFLRCRSDIKGTNIPPEWQDAWAKTVKDHKTNPRSHKNRFLSWIAYWPWSLVWTTINDPLKRACRRIYYELQGVYQRITDHVWQVEEMPPPIEAEPTGAPQKAAVHVGVRDQL